MAEAATTWRERQHEQTVREIRAVALRLLQEGGAAALSLRAIARQLGLTPGALYSYYDTRDELISALIRDVYGDLVDRLEAARDTRPADDLSGRLLAIADTYRSWAVAQPAEFQLIYGAPIQGYVAPPGGAAAAEAARGCALLVDLTVDARPRASTRAARWGDFAPEFVAAARAAHPRLRPSSLALALRLWGRMHGLVVLEVYDHLTPHLLERGKHFRAEMREAAEAL